MTTLFDKQTQTQISNNHSHNAIVVIINADENPIENQQSKDEFLELCTSQSIQVLDCVHFSNKNINPKFYITTGILETILEKVEQHNKPLVLFSHNLKASQQKNLEEYLGTTVIDRVGLILDIFATRARSYEGKLQVELAQLNHLSTRLIRGWTHLERQKGGIGLRGPGETQLEIDRRLVSLRIKALKKLLAKVENTRNLNRSLRKKKSTHSISIVGYTNAGKSTLFNKLTLSNVYVADQLFATLDTTLRKIKLTGAGFATLSDTVGFIQNLPHELIDAFKATLEETAQSDLILHVVDASHFDYRKRIVEVDEVLNQIGSQNIPQIIVMNKVDKTTQKYYCDEYHGKKRVWVSSFNPDSLEILNKVIGEFFKGTFIKKTIRIDLKAANYLSKIYELGEVISKRYQDGYILDVLMTKRYLKQLKKVDGIAIIN